MAKSDEFKLRIVKYTVVKKATRNFLLGTPVVLGTEVYAIKCKKKFYYCAYYDLESATYAISKLKTYFNVNTYVYSCRYQPTTVAGFIVPAKRCIGA